MSTTSTESPRAQIGVTGLAVMGSNIARNFARHGHTVALHNRSIAKTDALIAEHGSEGDFVRTETVEEFVAALQKPRRVLIMVKAGAPTDAVIEELANAMEPGDIIIDGGNSLYTDTIRREAAIRARGLHFVGAGISGGEEGALNGPSIMPGGPKESYEALGPLLESISAHVDGTPCCTHIGPDGSGHFVKMVHNGIEYAVMQAYAEGWELLEAADEVVVDVPEIFKSWKEGTVIRSWLLDLLVNALEKDPDLSAIRGYADDSGEGRWTVQAAIDMAVPVPAIAASLFARFVSRQEDSPAMKMIAAMRNEFGGHAVLPEDA